MRRERQARQFGNFPRRARREFRMRVQSRAHCRAANRQVIQPGQHHPQPLDVAIQLAYPPGHFLPHRQRRRIHQMRAPNFHHVGKHAGLGGQCIAQPFNRWDQHFSHARRCRNVHRRGKRIVRRLRHVHIIIWMNRLLAAQHAPRNLNRAIGNHFVRVHVGLRAAAGLPDAQWELIIQFAGNYFFGSLHDELRKVG